MEATNHGIEKEDHSSNVSHDHPNNPLATSIREMIDHLPRLSSDCCIYRVPKLLRKTNENAYTPEMVSIGPFHHGKESLQDMEEHKLRYLQAFLDRTSLSMESCIGAIKEWEEGARNYYAERIKLSSDEFVTMLLLDSSFIIESIWRYNFQARTEMISLENKLFWINNVRRDMILLENQIPFFVVEGLFNLSFPPNHQGPPSFLDISIHFFENLFLAKHTKQSISSSGIKHFVDLLRLCHLPPSSSSSLLRSRGNFVATRNATELQEAGMKFKKGTSNHLLDIKYTVEGLEIPNFYMGGSTESLIRNLIALEQCHYLFNSYIVDYVYFMKRLISNAKDADLLIQNEIVRTDLRDSAAVALVFSNLTGTVLPSGNYYFHDVTTELNAYSRVSWHKWKATLKRDYFSTPWIIASTIAAVILLGLTLIQTICAIVSL